MRSPLSARTCGNWRQSASPRSDQRERERGRLHRGRKSLRPRLLSSRQHQSRRGSRRRCPSRLSGHAGGPHRPAYKCDKRRPDKPPQGTEGCRERQARSYRSRGRAQPSTTTVWRRRCLLLPKRKSALGAGSLPLPCPIRTHIVPSGVTDVAAGTGKAPQRSRSLGCERQARRQRHRAIRHKVTFCTAISKRRAFRVLSHRRRWLRRPPGRPADPCPWPATAARTAVCSSPPPLERH